MKRETLDKICCFLAELLGTAILVFLGCMGCINTSIFSNTHFQSALNFGLVVLIVIQCFGCVSGSHLNPAVSVTAYVYGTLSLSMLCIYFVAQILGAFIGYGLLKAMLPHNLVDGLCVTTPSPEINYAQAVAIEFTCTAILALICCGVWDPRHANHHDSAAIRFGLAISCLALSAGQFTGCSMNPVRSFGPAIWNLNFTAHWVYWLGPLSGALVASSIYKYVFYREVIQAEIPLKQIGA